MSRIPCGNSSESSQGRPELLKLFKEQGVANCTLVNGVDQRELELFLRALGKPARGEVPSQQYWDDLVNENDISHIAVGHRVYGVAGLEELEERKERAEETQVLPRDRTSQLAIAQAESIISGEDPEAILSEESLALAPRLLQTLVLDGRVELMRKLVEKLLDLFSSANPAARLKAAEALAGLMESAPGVVKNELSVAASAALTDALRIENDRGVFSNLLEIGSAAAIAGIGQLGDDTYVPVLLERLAREKREAMVAELATALGKLRAASAVGPLARVLASKGVPILAKGLPEEVRAAAAWALGRIGTQQAREFLRKALRDKSSKVRSVARRGLPEE